MYLYKRATSFQFLRLSLQVCVWRRDWSEPGKGSGEEAPLPKKPSSLGSPRSSGRKGGGHANQEQFLDIPG